MYTRYRAHGPGDQPGSRGGSPLWLGPDSGGPGCVVYEPVSWEAGCIQQSSSDEIKEEIERRSWSDFLRSLVRLRR